MAIYIPHGDIEEVLAQKAKQGKRQLEPFSALMKSRGVPVAIVEDTNVFDNKAEVHTEAADLWYCLEGTVTFTTGGTLMDKTVRKLPDGGSDTTEWKGTGIEGGTDTVLSKGDWLYIPAGEPHVHRAAGTARLLIAKIPA